MNGCAGCIYGCLWQVLNPCVPSYTCPPSPPQAKLSELHKQIDELTGKVSGLQTENAALHSRTSILEKVLDMRNEQIQVMQEKKEVRGLWAGGNGLLGFLQ